MPSPLKLATVGAGFFSQFHYDAWHRLGVELVGICEHHNDRAAERSAAFGAVPVYPEIHKLLQQARPELLDIITPPPTHLTLIQAAAEAGVSVICQKPFCRNLEEARRAVQMAEEAGITLVVHENFRFQPWYREIKRQLEAGIIGKVHNAEFRLRPGDGQGERAYLDRQPYFQQMERFLVHETAIHLIDVFRFLFGEASSLYAQLRRLNPVIAGEDAGLILMQCGDGVEALFNGNRLLDHAAENHRLTMGEMWIEGDRGVIRLDGNGRLFLRPFGGERELPISYDWDNSGFGGDCVYQLQRHLVEHLRQGTPLENSARDYLSNLELEAAAYHSNESGCRILM